MIYTFFNYLKRVFYLFPLFILLSACNEWNQKPRSIDRPNIILCMSDDQGWGDMEYYRHPTLKTPNFNKMVEIGLRLDHFYASSPVCSPSRVSVLTGRHPNRAGAFSFGFPIDTGDITLAHLLKDNGYATAHFGKWHIGSIHKKSMTNPGKMGFEHWLSAPNCFELNPLLSRNGKIEKFKGEGSDILVKEALEFIKIQEKKDKPYFVVIWFANPHHPHEPSKKSQFKYKGMPEEFQNFYAEISDLDYAMGKLRKGLRSTVNYENTLVWYNGDNGGLPNLSNTGGRGSKGSIYEGGLRVPCIIEWPAVIKTAGSSNYTATTSDILPTILDICKIERKSDRPIDGISLGEIIKSGQSSLGPRAIGFWDCNIPGRVMPASELMDSMYALQELGLDSLFDDKETFKPKKMIKKLNPLSGRSAWLDWPWKFIRIKQMQGPFINELYNVANDPIESGNLIYAYPEQAAKMEEELNKWQMSVVKSYEGQD